FNISSKSLHNAEQPQHYIEVSALIIYEFQILIFNIYFSSEWTEGGHLWIQNVSTTPATRMDVINLQDHLDRKLQQRQARVTGICPIRRELYAQCFDEIIRQVTINCPERGLLLLRIRNEILMTFAAYNTLYESSTAFGLRKALQGDLGKLKLVNKVSTVELEKRNLEAEYLDLKAKFEAAEKRTGEKRDLDEKKHAEEINFLKNTNRQLKGEKVITV
uniref:Axonemal dynein light intermediate polypeptide 1 n=1 Tax=Callorhinchus milii TaxID=7868 RepID=A0A4W3IGH1_CALMI